jgi:hypothetical protein
MRNEIRKSGGGMLLAVHPGYSMDGPMAISSIKLGCQFRFEFGDDITRKYVDDYLIRFLHAVRTTRIAVSVLADRHSESQLRALGPEINSDRTIIICHAPDDAPTPIFNNFDYFLYELAKDKNVEKVVNYIQWSKLYWTFMRLGVRHIYLAGELCFRDGNGEQGCVYEARDWLSKFRPLKVTLLPSLTFPNMKTRA